MLLTIILTSALVLLIAYKTYGNLLARLLQLDPNRKTPPVELADGVDYDPIDWVLDEPALLSHRRRQAHRRADRSGMMFGWLPTLIWILLGAIFIGGIHDFGSLVASIRQSALHRRKSRARAHDPPQLLALPDLCLDRAHPILL
ncbi:MAG: hypothetical protein IPK53_17700 [bacterium]|nr:hypothetical protein [bacterium]